MYLRLFSLAFVTVFSAAVPCFAVTPPMPGMTNGDGTSANNGMKHANVSLTGTTLSVHIDEPPQTPVTMMSGFGVDYTPDKFNVLEDVFFNAQYGWLPEGFISLPAGSNIWLKRTAATQPVGSAFDVYEGGNMTEGMAAWTMNPIYTHDGFIWRWDGMMQHDYYTADRVGQYSMSFEVYVGDSAGVPVAGYTSGSATLQFTAAPEPTGCVLALLGVGLLAARRRSLTLPSPGGRGES